MRPHRRRYGLLVLVAGLLSQPLWAQLAVQDLSGPLSPANLAQSIAGSGVTVFNVQYSGADRAGGLFTGGASIIGFDQGVILSTGSIHGVVGPNTSDNFSASNGFPGDNSLSNLVGTSTFDAAILEFDFVPAASTIFIQYVFASEEYNEFVGQFNDVFAFFVNGVNCAKVGQSAVSVNTINATTNAGLYRNNDLSDGGGGINTGMDGLSVPLVCQAAVNANVTNHLKLAIADTSDSNLDTVVLLSASGVTTTPLSANFTAQCPLGACLFDVNEPITFIDSSVGADFWDYDWNGDGTFEEPGRSTPATTHAYSAAGSFRPRLRVRKGQQSSTFTHVELITVEDDATCIAPSSLSCGDSKAGNTAGAGSASEIGGYPCLVSPYPGREVAYTFEAPEDGEYAIDLTGPLSVDLDLLVVSGASGSCDPSGCVASSDRSGLAAESVSFSASAGDEFLVIVDSRGQSTSPFQIALSCPEPPDANFQVVPAFPAVNQNVSFFDTSTGPPTSWSWSFGDGGQSTSRTPVKSFASPGSYLVQLQVANDSGSDTVTRTVVVAPSNASILVSGPSNGTVGQAVRFSATASGCQPVGNAWQWLVSGGQIQGIPNFTAVDVVWSSPGTKTVTALNAACGQAQGSRAIELMRQGPPGIPAAPTNVTAQAVSSTEVELHWQDNSTNEDGFLVQRLEDGSFADVAVAPANATSVRVSVADVLFPTVHPTTFRVLAFNATGESLASALHARNGGEVEVTTEAEPCDPERSLCLLGKRFAIEAEWVANFGPGRGVGHPVMLTEDTGYFWFFSPQNVEVVIKVLDGRAITGKYWVFFGALSNQEFRLRVTDTQFGNQKEYFNSRGQFASVADTRALPSETEASSLAGTIVRAEGAEWSLGRGLHPRDLDVDFSWTPVQPSSTPADVFFVDGSPALLRSRTWTLGDATPPVHRFTPFYRHVYQGGGAYDVTLDVVQGVQMGTATNRLEITPPLEPKILVDAPVVARRVNRRVTLAAVGQDCTQDIGNWSWEVDGGLVVSASDSGPTIDVRWPIAGMKTVRARNSGCGDALGQAGVAIFTPNAAVPAPQTEDELVCEPSETVLCLRDGRFRVRVNWQAPNFNPPSGPGRAERVTGETGYFWFFNEANVELIVKVLDGRAINGNFWVFYGALSDVRYTIEVTDLETGRVKVYENPLKNLASVGDTAAFPGN